MQEKQEPRQSIDAIIMLSSSPPNWCAAFTKYPCRRSMDRAPWTTNVRKDSTSSDAQRPNWLAASIPLEWANPPTGRVASVSWHKVRARFKSKSKVNPTISLAPSVRTADVRVGRGASGKDSMPWTRSAYGSTPKCCDKGTQAMMQNPINILQFSLPSNVPRLHLNAWSNPSLHGPWVSAYQKVHDWPEHHCVLPTR